MPLHQYECAKGHISEYKTRAIHDEKPEVIPCQHYPCYAEGDKASWIPSAPVKMLMDRATNRKHSQPDEWDPQTNPKLKPKRHLEPG